MSLNLTSLEKQAVAKVLLDIVHADGRVTVGEGLYFQQLQNVLGISDSDINKAKGMNALGCLLILKNLLPIEKAALAVMMLEMIQADGNVDKEELKVFAVVCAAADIPLPKTA